MTTHGSIISPLAYWAIVAKATGPKRGFVSTVASNLPFDDGLQGSAGSVHGNDNHVLAGLLTRHFQCRDGADRHLIIVSIDGIRILVHLEQGPGDLLALGPLEIGRLGSDDRHVGMGVNGVFKSLAAAISRRRARETFELNDLGIPIFGFGESLERRACLARRSRSR